MNKKGIEKFWEEKIVLDKINRRKAAERSIQDKMLELERLQKMRKEIQICGK